MRRPTIVAGLGSLAAVGVAGVTLSEAFELTRRLDDGGVPLVVMHDREHRLV